MQKLTKQPNGMGFTIVELLIVIVVIAVLASISVATYGGVKQRSEDSAIVSKVRSFAQLIEAYAATTGGYAPHADWACIGEPSEYPAENGYDAEWCRQPSNPEPISAGISHPINHTVNAKLKTLVNRIPDTRTPEIDFGGGYKSRGMHYDSASGWNGSKPSIWFDIKGDRQCPIGVRLYAESGNTHCLYTFESLTSESGS